MIALLRFLASCALAVIVTAGAAGATTPGGVVITNAVSVTYSDGSVAYAARSNTVQVTTAEISALVVSPKNATWNAQTDAFAANTQIVRVFTLTNSSNIPDAYTVTAAATTAGSIASLAFVAADGTTSATSINGTRSVLVQPGTSISVTVTVVTQGVPVGTDVAVTLTARTTVTGTTNGLVSDSGEAWAMPVSAAQFAGPGGAQSNILKTVDTVRSEAVPPGTTVVYQIAFENYGQMPATNAVLTDAVPPGIVADATSVTVNGHAAAAQSSGSTLTVALGTVAPQVPETIAFHATVGATQTLGTSYVNVASLSADGVNAIATTPAGVIAGNADVVYDGFSDGRTPVPGALIALVNPVTKLPVAMSGTNPQTRGTSSAAALAINPSNVNPFTTGSSGTYGFAIPAPAPGTTSTYDLLISAPGYISRDIGVVLTPDPSDVLYSVALTSKDGQPLAQAGGYALTGNSVMLANVFGLLGNLPLFTTTPIAVTKTADKPSGAPGDTIAYTIAVASTAASGLGATSVTDTLPAGLTYAAGTARVDGHPVEPVRTGSRLVWQLPVLAPNATYTISYVCVILPNVAARTTLTNAVAVSGAIPGTMLSVAGNASVSIVTTSGIFSERAAITGRVFLDPLGDGLFRDGDAPVAGVRLFLEDGESATTDAKGRYSFHGVRSGMHVLRLDETTLPPGARAFPDRRYDSVRSPVRLIHGVMDAGLLQDVTFAVAPVK
jgi:uncharacterized repeat protein (TIGR01451 family)